MAKTQTVLKTDTMTMRFGGVTAVFQLNLDIREHQIVGVHSHHPVPLHYYREHQQLFY